MKTLVAYGSGLGCSEKSARLIQRILGIDCDIVALDREGAVRVESYDTLIIGGPVYQGRMHDSVRAFCQANLSALLQRRIGLYICCMQSGEAAIQELRGAFPAGLLAHASATGIFGGEMQMERINFIERFIVRAVVRTEYRVSTFSQDRVELFLRQLFANAA